MDHHLTTAGTPAQHRDESRPFVYAGPYGPAQLHYPGKPPSQRPLAADPNPFPSRRLLVVVWTAASVAGLYGLQHVLFPHRGVMPTNGWQWAYAALCLLWVLPILPGSLGLVGSLWYRHRDSNQTAPIDTLVSWRIVSRGTNVDALRDTIQRCRREMAQRPLFPYVIEVVVDRPVPGLSDEADVVIVQVPADYETPKGARFKARALQYALDNSTLPDDAWIVHLDEDTQPTRSGIEGIAQMIREEEAAGTYRIGQGCLLYHRSWQRHPILTLADMVRTGDDLARFHLQHRLGRTIFGMRGSYVVVRNSVAKEIGFDFGPEGSIAEDAFWALVQMHNGRRSRWCDGYLEEQSTQSVADFIKQRQRWFLGLVKVSRHAPVPLRWRLPLAVNTAIWALAPLGFLYTIIHLFYGADVPDTVRAVANLAYGSYVVLYVMGLRINLDEAGERRWWKRQFWYAGVILLLPLFSALEAAGVIYGMVKPEPGFHVVKKGSAAPVGDI